MPYASALSEHPITSQAIGEACGQVLDTLGGEVDLCFLSVTRPHGGALEDCASVTVEALRPRAMIGCAAVSVIGSGVEVEDSAAVTLFAYKSPTNDIGVLPEIKAATTSLPITNSFATGSPAPLTPGDWEEFLGFPPATLLLIGDPFSFNGEEFLSQAMASNPKLQIAGGMASAAFGPGGNRLAWGSDGKSFVQSEGAVGIFLGENIKTLSVVSQGCKPVGSPYVVTRARGNVIEELGGKAPLERLEELLPRLSEAELAILNAGGLHIGRVVDEHQTDFGQGDFLVRNVTGIIASSGAMSINDEAEVGTTVQFHLRDALSAHEDLASTFQGREAQGALVFTCNGRGSNLFDEPSHDAMTVARSFGKIPSSGFFAAGEFGPVGKRNFLHGLSASVVLFAEDDGLGHSSQMEGRP